LASDTTSMRGVDFLLLIRTTATKFQINRKDGPHRMLTSLAPPPRLNNLASGHKPIATIRHAIHPADIGRLRRRITRQEYPKSMGRRRRLLSGNRDPTVRRQPTGEPNLVRCLPWHPDAGRADPARSADPAPVLAGPKVDSRRPNPNGPSLRCRPAPLPRQYSSPRC
jgi:hypothetical protein